MIIYRYDSNSREYLDNREIPDSHVTIKGRVVYGIPAYYTITPPLDYQEGYVSCYNPTLQKWYYEEDHRGTLVYLKKDLTEIIVNFIGAIPKDKYLFELPEPKNEYQIWNGEKYVYPDLTELKARIKSDLDFKYNKKLEIPSPCKNYYVLPSWATIYSNTLVAMQQDLQEDGILDEEYKILLISDPLNGILEQVKVNSLEQFMPFYNKVKEIYKELSTTYHDKIAKISILKSEDALVRLILNY